MADKHSVVETANNSTMAIRGQVKFEGLDSILCDSASNSLLSTSQITLEKNALVIISAKDAIGIEKKDTLN